MYKALILTILLASCTPYQSRGIFGGWYETQHDENVYNVAFHGNGYTSIQRATDLTLLRCAELTVGYGYRYFTVIESNSHRSVSTTKAGDNIYTVTRPRTQNRIVMSREKLYVESYNAALVEQSVREQYGINEDRMRRRDRDRLR